MYAVRATQQENTQSAQLRRQSLAPSPSTLVYAVRSKHRARATRLAIACGVHRVLGERALCGLERSGCREPCQRRGGDLLLGLALLVHFKEHLADAENLGEAEVRSLAQLPRRRAGGHVFECPGGGDELVPAAAAGRF